MPVLLSGLRTVQKEYRHIFRYNMANQEYRACKLDKGMKYTVNGEYFNRNIYRHLRFAHPTYIYGDLSFELMMMVCHTGSQHRKKNITSVCLAVRRSSKVVIVMLLPVKQRLIRQQMFQVGRQSLFHGITAVNLFDYYGTLKHGFFNSVLSQKDCLKTTDGYNYLALDDDVWMYTGVTSVNGDQSNVGFVLSNQRTMETKYYECEGATEASAMSSAEGQVQNLKYTATFPLLLNISGEPTYFIALKDDAGLVKKYAMVNVQKYQIVAIGDSVSQCEDNYLDLLLSNGVKEEAKDDREIETITGEITKIAQAVIDGTSHYYLMIDGSEDIFDVSVVDYIDVVRCEAGQTVTMEYKKGEKADTVVSLKIK